MEIDDGGEFLSKETKIVMVPVSVVCERYKITPEELKVGAKDIDIKFESERTGFLKFRQVVKNEETVPLIRRVVFNRSYQSGRIYTKPVREFFGLTFDDFSQFCDKNVLTPFGAPILPCGMKNDYTFSPTDFKTVFGQLYNAFGTLIDTARVIYDTVSKSEAKKKIKRNFKIGDLISLKTKSVCGSREIIKGFEVKKCVYTVNKNEVNVIIVKQIYGPEEKIFTLNRHDCEKLHLKYEPGLQVFSMMLNWGTFKEKEK